jgi:hypothetical protein
MTPSSTSRLFHAVVIIGATLAGATMGCADDDPSSTSTQQSANGTDPAQADAGADATSHEPEGWHPTK